MEDSLPRQLTLVRFGRHSSSTSSRPLDTPSNIRFCAILIFALSVAARGDTRPSRISYEESIPAFRQGVDAWRVQYGAKGEWTADGHFTVTAPEKREFIMNYGRYPGMKPFPGAEEVVVKAEFAEDVAPATAELVLFEFPGGERMRFHAPFARETRFATHLDPSKRYQLGILGVHRGQGDGKPWTVAFSSFGGVFTTTKAEALRVSAETGNPLHIVREGCGEKPVLRVRNAARERIAARGALKMEGFRGDPVDMPVDVAPDGGETVDIPLPEGLPNGVWRIAGELVADDGSAAKVETRFAVMDYHGKTPKQPRGTFRLGINWHIGRFTPSDLKLTAAAMVACGAKLARGDMASMSRIQHDGPDCWDFAHTDKLMDTLEDNGISMDAIVFNTPKWAAKPENRTNANWKAWLHGPPMPGTFGRFCEGLAARYGARIDYYEIGNEWDLNFNGTVDEAVAVQREAYESLKRGCPDVCVIPNGWTTYSDGGNIAKTGHTGFHEAFMRKAKDWFDIDTIHCHGAFARYVRDIRDGYFPLRRRTGVADKPWFSNETALTSVWSERNAALTVWKKILWAWANGSVDYIWYNLKGTGWNPKDPEQGYGLMAADFRPRESYVAFAALATAVGGGEFRRTVFDDGDRFCLEFAKDGKTVLAAWNQSGAEMSLPVATDAARAWLVDPMGNRSALPMADGQVLFGFSAEPRVLVLEGATFAKPDVWAMRTLPAAERETILIPHDSPGRAPDFVLDRPEQVHDFFEAVPDQIGRLWAGPKDNSAKVWLSKDPRGFRIRVEVEDDVHSQPFDGVEQYKGDDVQIAFAAPGQGGQWEFGFAHRDDGRPAVNCWIAPSGYNEAQAAAWISLRTGRDGTVTRYDALIPYAEEAGFTEKTLEDGIRFNLMLNDNDGDGRDATIEIVPETFHSKEILLAPVIRFVP